MNETHPSIEELVDYAHGELSASQDAAVHAHLAECGSCADLQAQEASLTDLLRAHARAEERELPESVIARIREAVARKPRDTAWARLKTAFGPALALPVAAAIGVALYLGVRGTHATAPATTIDASYYVDSHAALASTAPFSEEAPMPATLTSETTAADQRPVDVAR